MFGWIKKKWFERKYRGCDHNYVPVLYKGRPAKSCLRCGSVEVISRQQFKALFGFSFPKWKAFSKPDDLGWYEETKKTTEA